VLTWENNLGGSGELGKSSGGGTFGGYFEGEGVIWEKSIWLGALRKFGDDGIFGEDGALQRLALWGKDNLRDIFLSGGNFWGN